jgi:hypothetical protein
MAQTKAVRKYWKSQPVTNFNWEKDASSMSDEGARAIVEDIVINLNCDLLAKWLSFKRLRELHHTPLTEKSIIHDNLVKEFMRYLFLPVFDYWAEFYTILVDKDKNMCYYKNRLNVLLSYLLFTLGQLPKPSEEDCKRAEALIADYGKRNRRIDVVQINQQENKQKPLGNTIDIAIDDCYNEYNNLI